MHRELLLPLLLLLRGGYPLEECEPVVGQPRVVGRLLVLEPGELPVQALLPLHEGGQRDDLLARGRPAEVNHREPGFRPVSQDPVPHAPEPPVGHHLDRKVG